MSQATRIRDFIAILENSRQPVSRQRLMDELEISAATFKRDLDVLKDQMHAPIKWLRGSGVRGEGVRDRGYVLEDKGWSSGKLGLPRAWFTASEIYSLLMIYELASHMGPGLLTEHLQPLITRVTLMMGAAEDSPADVRARVRLLSSASKRMASPHFETVARAAVKKRRLNMVYFTRSRNERSERKVSPQVIVHYKENWYLVAWCHKSDGLRMFALDAIEKASLLPEPAKVVAKKRVDEIIGRDFGLYAGNARQWAKLLFTPKQTPWIKSQTWHAEQTLELQEDGSCLLTVPYSDTRELILEILRFGPEVRVLAPLALQREAAQRLRDAAAQYL